MTMNGERIHRAISQDGTEIAGSVHGNGAPLVFVHGAFADGENGWRTLVPRLADQYRCYLLNLRGRGLSGHSDDFSRDRLVQDVTAFTESLDEPAGLVGLSGGALLSIAAAERTPAVTSVAAYEPPVFEVISDDVFARFKGTIGRVEEMAADGKLADAARTFVEFVANEEELTAATEMNLFDALAPNVLTQLQEFSQALKSESSPTHPQALAKIKVPVLLMHGTRSNPHPWFIDGVRHVAEHVTNPSVRQVTGAGHLGPILEPEPVANELRQFFATAR